MSKIVDLNKERLIKTVKDQTGLTKENSNIETAIDEAVERGKMYKQLSNNKAQALLDKEKEPYPCCNMVCSHYKQCEFEHHNLKTGEITFNGRNDYCLTSDSHNCMFQMNDHPPNSISYNEYMPSHIEALDMLEKHKLLSGSREEYEKANAQYNKANNSNDRHDTEIKGIYFNQIRAIVAQIQKEIPQFFNPDRDEIALAQSFCFEIEKAMGIYPNIKLS